jgi:hypothetical protein
MHKTPRSGGEFNKKNMCSQVATRHHLLELLDVH